MGSLFRLKPAAIGGVVAAAYALAQGAWLMFVDKTQPFDAATITALAMTAWAAYTHAKVTPVARPRNNAGERLVAINATPQRAL